MKWSTPIFAAMLMFTIASSSEAQGPPAGLFDLAPPVQHNGGVVGFERQQFTVERVRGKILIDGIESAEDIVERGTREIRLIEVFDGLDFSDTRAFKAWGKTLRGTRTFTYDNVFLKQRGGEIAVMPLVLLPPRQRLIANVDWNIWIGQQQARVVEKRRQAEEQQAQRDRDQALSTLVAKQTENVERLASLQSQIAQNSRRRAYLAPRIAIGSTGTGLALNGGGVQFVSSSLVTQPVFGFPVQGIAFNANP